MQVVVVTAYQRVRDLTKNMCPGTQLYLVVHDYDE